MQTVGMKEPVITASLIHHMRKACGHPTTGSHHYRHKCKDSCISDNTHL